MATLVRIVLALLLPIAIARAEGAPRLLELCDVEISPLDGMACEIAYAPAANRSAYRLEGMCQPVGIWIADEETGGCREVLGDTAEVRYRVLSLSLDGRLAWARSDGSGTRLFVEGKAGEVKGIDAEEPLQLAGAPAWSPDGTRILFPRTTAEAAGRGTDLWQVDVETGELSRLTQAGDASGEVAWSAGGETVFLEDGERVRFARLETR